MAAGIVINTEEQKQRMISLLEKCIDEDCVQGRKYLDEKLREAPDVLPPHLLETIKKNTDVREGVYRNMIEDMWQETDFPVSLHQIFGRLLSAFSRSLPESDPAREDYTTLALRLIPAKHVPSSMRDVVMRSVSGNMVFGGALMLPKEKATPENIESIQFRQMTIDKAMHEVLESFYMAATSQSREELNEKNMRYRRFCERIDSLLGSELPNH